MTRKISIDPITRLEGHGKISIFLDDAGAVEDCYFQIPELRGFEQFVVGRPIEELPRIVTRICGVCPASHHMASAKAVDACFGNQVAPLAHKLRDMYYNAHYIHSHTAHFYALAAPDFVMGPDADPAVRNILGVVAKVGLEIGGKVIRVRGLAQEIQRTIGGRNTQDIWCLPGGVAKRLEPSELEQIKTWVDELYDFTQFSLQLFHDVVLGNPTYVDLIVNGPYTLNVQNMGLVDKNNAPNFYDGKVRVVDYEGTELHKYEPRDYAQFVAEHVEPWSYLKFPFLKKRGWKGFVEGINSSIYCATPQRGSTWPIEWPHRAHRRRSRRCIRLSGLTLAARSWLSTGPGWWRWCRMPRHSRRTAPTPRSPASSSGSSPRRSLVREWGSSKRCEVRSRTTIRAMNARSVRVPT